MKLGTIVNALPALKKIAGENLTIKTLYKVSMLMKTIDKELEFYNTERNKIIEELCKKDEGTRFIIPKENRDEVDKRIKELSDIDIDPAIEPIKISTAEKICLSYNDLCALDGIIELCDQEELKDGVSDG